MLRHPAEIPLSLAAMEIWRSLDTLLGPELAPLCSFHRGGQLAVAENATDMQRLEARAAEVATLGWRHEELIDRNELRRLVPALAEHCVGGLVSRADGHANPYRTTQAFRWRAEAEGARIVEGAAVTGLLREGRCWRVATSRGEFESDVVVNCAGAWGSRIAAAAGERLPDGHFAPMMMVTERVSEFLAPVVIGIGRKLSFKQTEHGTLLIGGGLTGHADLERGTTTLAFSLLARSAGTVSALFPTLGAVRIVRAWAGIEALMPDEIPVIGPATAAPGLWHAFGFSGHGFQLGPIVGSILAQLITTGHSELPIDAFRPGRFAEGAARIHASAI